MVMTIAFLHNYLYALDGHDFHCANFDGQFHSSKSQKNELPEPQGSFPNAQPNALLLDLFPWHLNFMGYLFFRIQNYLEGRDNSIIRVVRARFDPFPS